MKAFLAWWYGFSLPRRGIDQTPAERERTRYARLTAAFTLLLLIITVLLTPWSYIKSYNPAAPVVATIGLLAVVAAVVCSKMGLNIVAASLIVSSTIINVVGTMLTNPLDPTLIPIFGALVIPVILSGALMPPVAALIVGGLNSTLIILIVVFQTHTLAYDAMMRLGMASVSIALPVTLQIIVAVVTYVIMRNLSATIRRADRAEEIIALQSEIAEFERSHAQNQQQLEEGIAVIAQVHSEVARGNLNARVPMGTENVLWQVAVPLNNLLNRVQQWKSIADQATYTQFAITSAVKELQDGRMFQRVVFFQKRTGTPIDPLLAEINYLSEQASRWTLPRPPHPIG